MDRLVAMHESDESRIVSVCDPENTGRATKGDFAVYLLEKKVSFESFMASMNWLPFAPQIQQKKQCNR